MPRVLVLRPDGSLGIAPAPELAALRRRHWRVEDSVFDKPSAQSLDGARGDCLEVLISLDVGPDAVVGLDVFADEGFAHSVPIRFDRPKGILRIGDQTGAFQLNADETCLHLHLFIDRSVLELFVNDRVCFTAQARPSPGSDALRLVVDQGTAVFKTAEAWEIQSIWSD